MLKDRTGEKHITNQGYSIKIIEYISCNNCTIQFEDGLVLKNQYYDSIKKGQVENPYHPSIFGVGYLGEGMYSQPRRDGVEAIYKTWCGILNRCYGAKFHSKHTYENVVLCKDWCNFPNFVRWYIKSYNSETMRGWHLDKDILVKGNKVYSPETCCFVPSEVNNLIIFSNSARGEYPVGVTFHERLKKYAANISLGGVQKHLGYFDEVSEAFNSYKIAKERYIKFVAEKYFGKIGENVYQKLINYSIDTMLMCEVIDEEQT